MNKTTFILTISITLLCSTTLLTTTSKIEFSVHRGVNSSYFSTMFY